MSCDQTLDKLSEKLYSRLLVQEEHSFQKGAQCAPGHNVPLATGAQKKPGLDRVKYLDVDKSRKDKAILTLQKRQHGEKMKKKERKTMFRP